MSRSEFGQRGWARQYRWAMQNGLEHCRACFTKYNLTFAHILAWSCGGSNGMSNMTILCANCNNKAGKDYCDYPALNYEESYWQYAAQLKVGDFTAFGQVKHMQIKSKIIIAQFVGDNKLREYFLYKKIATLNV